MRLVKRAAALVLFLLLLPCSRADAEVILPAVSARGAILIEAASGRVLYEKSADRVQEMASTTKIMTAILAIESGNLDRIVTVSSRAAGTTGSSMELKEGETLPLIELLYGLMLQSGNDAAIAIAEAVSGSVEAFVRAMNEKAAALGLSGTHFANPNGLHNPEHHTTARELATLAAYAMQNETFRTIVGTEYHRTENCSLPRSIRNKNKFLSQYEGCNGVKTGYTKAAGKCLVIAAKRNGMQLIGVVLDAPQMWEDAKTLLDYGFATFELQHVVHADEVFTVTVLHGEKNSLPAAPKQDILYPIRSDGSESLSIETSCYDTVAAPVALGQTLGRIAITLNGYDLCTVEIVATEAAPRRTYRSVLLKALSDWK